MKLSNLYTEDLVLENNKGLKGLLGRASKMFSKAKQTPNPRHVRVEAIIKEVYQEIWGDYFENPKALARIENYQNSMKQHVPRLSKISSEEALRDEIEKMFRNRAGHIIRTPKTSI